MGGGQVGLTGGANERAGGHCPPLCMLKNALFLSDLVIGKFRYIEHRKTLYRVVDGSNECRRCVVISGRYRSSETHIAIDVRDEESGVLLVDVVPAVRVLYLHQPAFPLARQTYAVR